eukprot:gene39426-48001_t
MTSRVKVLLAGTATYIAAVAIGYTYSSVGSNQQPKGPCACRDPSKPLISEEERHKAYAKNASKYDKEIGNDELVMGLSLIRWWLMRNLTGKVLEVGCGTGLNLSYYSVEKVDKLVAVDSVPEMLQEARKKNTSQKIDLRLMDAHHLQFDDNFFDVAVDSFGLCSYHDPVQVLRELNRVVKADGQIILLEHGRGLYSWINNILDRNAYTHAHNW